MWTKCIRLILGTLDCERKKNVLSLITFSLFDIMSFGAKLIGHLQTSEASFVRKSAASMLSGKRPVQAAVSSSYSYYFTCLGS